MGSLLYDAVGQQRSVDELNSSHSEAVFRFHQAYIEAGSQLIETNTFGANRHKLAALGLGERVAELNHRGVKIAREAREAAKHEVLIAGSIGPVGMMRHVKDLPEAEVLDTFREQAGALEERGVDLFILETFSDVEELVIAIDAIRSFSRLPVIAQVTYSEEGHHLFRQAPAGCLGEAEGKEYSSSRNELYGGPAVAFADLEGVGRLLISSPFGHAQCRISAADWRPDGISKVLA